LSAPPCLALAAASLMSPKISVCIPVRNGGAFLPLAVDSVLSQSFDDMELIVVDNCSTDGTAEWLERKNAEVGKIKFFRNAADIGLARNFNACLASATGAYVKFLCADDLLLPGSLQRMADALDADPSAALAVGARRLIDDKGATIAVQRYARRSLHMAGEQAINRCLFGKNYIGEPTAVMFRRSAAARGFSEAFPHLIDLEMWFHLLEQGRLISLPDEVCAIRRHAAQMTHQNTRSGALLDDNVRLFEQYGRKSYVRAGRARSLSRKARLAYRVWLCRDGISVEKREAVLARHSSKVLYHAAIPLFARMLSAWRSLRLLLRTGSA
jgi:glycosyltransferase involved in cell wall biosynthesis